MTHREEDFKTEGVSFERLLTMEDHHFWHDARHRWILEALRSYGCPPNSRVLEIGCGGGAVARALVAAGYRYTGVDTAERIIRKARERLPSIDFICGSAEDLPPTHRGSYDVIAFFDVIEHLASPLDVLRSALKQARPGAWVIATVPARQALFTVIDAYAGHKKRYERGELKSLLLSAGISDVHEHGFFRWLVPLLAFQRHRLQADFPPPLTPEQESVLAARNDRVPAAPVNALLRFVSALELRVGFSSSENRLGSSQLAVGRYHPGVPPSKK